MRPLRISWRILTKFKSKSERPRECWQYGNSKDSPNLKLEPCRFCSPEATAKWRKYAICWRKRSNCYNLYASLKCSWSRPWMSGLLFKRYRKTTKIFKNFKQSMAKLLTICITKSEWGKFIFGQKNQASQLRIASTQSMDAIPKMTSKYKLLRCLSNYRFIQENEWLREDQQCPCHVQCPTRSNAFALFC